MLLQVSTWIPYESCYKMTKSRYCWWGNEYSVIRISHYQVHQNCHISHSKTHRLFLSQKKFLSDLLRIEKENSENVSFFETLHFFVSYFYDSHSYIILCIEFTCVWILILLQFIQEKKEKNSSLIWLYRNFIMMKNVNTHFLVANLSLKYMFPSHTTDMSLSHVCHKNSSLISNEMFYFENKIQS